MVPGGSRQRGGGSGAGAEICQRVGVRVPVCPQPPRRVAKPMGEEVDIENILPVGRFLVDQEVEQQRADTRLLKRLRDILIARAQAATPAAVREKYDSGGALG